MYESVFWSSCAASHDDWSISTVTKYIMLKNTWCWSDFYAKFLWSWDLRRTHQDSITETFCFESNWSISKQFVELDCWVLLNVKSEPSAWTAVAFLGQVALYHDYFLVTSTSALPNQGCIAVSLLTYCSGGYGKKLGQRASLWVDETNWCQTGSNQNILLWFNSLKWNISIQEYQTTSFFHQKCVSKHLALANVRFWR